MNLIQAFGSNDRYPFINMDLIAELRPIRDANKTVAYGCYNSKEEMIGRISDYEAEAAQYPAVVIPDNTGSLLIAFWPASDGTVSASRYPVIAWKIGGSRDNDPIICESLPTLWCLELKTGQFCFPEMASFNTLADAMEYAADEIKSAKERVKSILKNKPPP